MQQLATASPLLSQPPRMQPVPQLRRLNLPKLQGLGRGRGTGTLPHEALCDPLRPWFGRTACKCAAGPLQRPVSRCRLNPPILPDPRTSPESLLLA